MAKLVTPEGLLYWIGGRLKNTYFFNTDCGEILQDNFDKDSTRPVRDFEDEAVDTYLFEGAIINDEADVYLSVKTEDDQITLYFTVQSKIPDFETIRDDFMDEDEDLSEGDYKKYLKDDIAEFTKQMKEIEPAFNRAFADVIRLRPGQFTALPITGAKVSTMYLSDNDYATFVAELVFKCTFD